MLTTIPVYTYFFTVTKDNPQGKSNLQIWNIANGECVFDTIQRKLEGWEPCWMEKLNICAKQVGNTVNFYKDNNFSKIFVWYEDI